MEIRADHRGALLASVFVDLLDAELAAGRWQMLPDGEIKPVDKPAGKVLQFSLSQTTSAKEESHAQVQGPATAS